MTRARIALCLTLLLGAAQSAGAGEKLFFTRLSSCEPAKTGAPGGPVSLGDKTLMMAGLTCELQGRTPVSRMNADLMDASCRMDGAQPFQTRLLVATSPEGVTIVSRELGTFILTDCAHDKLQY